VPKLIGGPLDGGEVASNRLELIFLPLPGRPLVAAYRRRWEDGHYQYQGTQHENTVLGRPARDRDAEAGP